MNIAILVGSNRKQSTGSKLCRYIEQQLIAKGNQVSFFDLYEQPVPFYNPDHRTDPDAHLIQLKKVIKEAHAIVLSTPEYHGTVSGVLKNALDHLGSEQFDSKAVLSVSSAGGAVGTSSLLELQTIVRNVHGINCPEWLSIGGEQRIFNAQGEPESLLIKYRTHRVLHYFLQLADALNSKFNTSS